MFVDVGVDSATNLAVTSLTIGDELATTGPRDLYPGHAAQLRQRAAQPGARQAVLFGKARDRRQRAADGPARSPAEIRRSRTRPGATGRRCSTIQRARRLRRSGPARKRRPGSRRRRTHCRPVKETVPVLLVNGKPAETNSMRRRAGSHTPSTRSRRARRRRNVPARPTVVTVRLQRRGPGRPDAIRLRVPVRREALTVAEVRRLETHLRGGWRRRVLPGAAGGSGVYNRLLYRDGEGILPARLSAGNRPRTSSIFSFYADEDELQAAAAVGLSPRDIQGPPAGGPLHRIRYDRAAAARLKPRKVLSFMPAERSRAPEKMPRGPPAAGPVNEPAPGGMRPATAARSCC